MLNIVQNRLQSSHVCLVADEWSRPIFGLTSNYKGMTREERQQRDLDQQMPQRRRLRYRRDSAVSVSETVILIYSLICPSVGTWTLCG